MKFIKKFENFTGIQGHAMDEVCSECQCKMNECECGGPMAYSDEMEEEYPSGDLPTYFEEEEDEMMSGEDEMMSGEDEMMSGEEEEEEEEEMMPDSERRMGHIMSFQEAKKAKPDFLDLDKDGDKKESMKKAAADKKKGGKEDKKEDKKDDKKSTKKGGLSKAQEKLPEGLKKAIKAGVRD